MMMTEQAAGRESARTAPFPFPLREPRSRDWVRRVAGARRLLERLGMCEVALTWLCIRRVSGLTGLVGVDLKVLTRVSTGLTRLVKT